MKRATTRHADVHALHLRIETDNPEAATRQVYGVIAESMAEAQAEGPKFSCRCTTTPYQDGDTRGLDVLVHFRRLSRDPAHCEAKRLLPALRARLEALGIPHHHDSDSHPHPPKDRKR